MQGLIEPYCKRFFGVELSGLADKDLSEIGIVLPGVYLPGVDESVSRDPTADAHLVDLLLGGS